MLNVVAVAETIGAYMPIIYRLPDNGNYWSNCGTHVFLRRLRAYKPWNYGTLSGLRKM